MVSKNLGYHMVKDPSKRGNARFYHANCGYSNTREIITRAALFLFTGTAMCKIPSLSSPSVLQDGELLPL